MDVIDGPDNETGQDATTAAQVGTSCKMLSLSSGVLRTNVTQWDYNFGIGTNGGGHLLWSIALVTKLVENIVETYRILVRLR